MTLTQWLAEYGDSHRHPVNIAIHKLCVPAIMFAVFGLAWSIPAAVNPAYVLLALGLLFYLRLSWRMAVAIGLMCAGILLALNGLQALNIPVLPLSATVFVIAWIGQFIGHKIEGKKPSFFKDVQFLLIGPAWTLSHLFRALHLKM
jgi:uncharacterized membrane protein YGL010W